MGYESWYLKASHPTEPLGVWIRYTTHQKPGEAERGSLWFTLFQDGAPQAAKVTPGPEALSRGDGAFIRIGDSEFADGRVRGSALDASWDLTFEHPEPELRHLPRGWMYKAPVPRTKLTSPFPAARFSGRVAFGDRTVELDSWPGMVGHNWGAEHAERWIWLHGVFEPGACLDVALGRVKVGPALTPWIANGALSIDGERRRVRGLARVDESAHGGTIKAGGLRIEVAAPQVVSWIYADPSGGEHRSTNCSIAAIDLTVGARTLRTQHGGAWELGTREAPIGVDVQPYPDP
jgi:hypothetical protein